MWARFWLWSPRPSMPWSHHLILIFYYVPPVFPPCHAGLLAVSSLVPSKHLDTCAMCFHTCLTVCLVWDAYRFLQVEKPSKPLDMRTGTLMSGTDWRYKFGSCPHTCIMKQSESPGVEEHSSPRRWQRKEYHRLSPADEDDAKRKASKETKMKRFKDAEENHSVV